MTEVRWISERSDSRIGELGNVIVKEHRPEADLARPATVRARHEFDVLTMLHASMPATYSVPRPLSLDGGTLTLERAAGTPLDVLIRDGKRQRNAIELLHEPVRRAGEWLRTMQQATTDGPGQRDAGGPPVVDAALSHARAVFSGRTQRRVVAGLEELAGRVRQNPTGHHGDYWPGNIFIAEKGVQVIDFEGYRAGHPLEDVAYFLLQLQLLMPRHQRHLPHLRGAFLEGYGPVDGDALRLFTMTKTLHLMARDAGARHSFLLRIWMRRTLRNVVRGCLR